MSLSTEHGKHIKYIYYLAAPHLKTRWNMGPHLITLKGLEEGFQKSRLKFLYAKKKLYMDMVI